MSQTWVIKDTAPVDAASRELSAQQCSFTSNGHKFSSISVVAVEEVAIYILMYDNFEVAGDEFGIGFDWSGNEAYKILEFDTAPTGELLAWLQKNADKQVDTEYLTRKSELTSVANAIRAKGGTTAQLVYPDGFVSAIQAIQTGTPLQIVVTASAGATITATKGSKVVSGVADANGQCTLIVDEVGTWTVVGTLGAQSATADVLIGEAAVALKMYVPVFADNDWSTIIEACQSGAVPDTWAVGDSKPMIINGTEYQIDILGKNHDDYYDGSGKAPLTFILHNCYDTRYQMNSSNSSSTKAWKNTRMRKTVLPSILKLMPEEVQSAIKQVSKTTGDGGENYATYSTTAETLFLLSQSEVFRLWGTESTEEGQPYVEYFGQGSSAAAAAKKIKKSRAGEAWKWWTRTAYTGTGFYRCIVSNEGYEQNSGGTETHGVVFAFCF